MLSGNGKLRSRTMLLNGRELVLGENDEIPVMEGEIALKGTIEIAPGACAFIII